MPLLFVFTGFTDLLNPEVAEYLCENMEIFAGSGKMC